MKEVLMGASGGKETTRKLILLSPFVEEVWG